MSRLSAWINNEIEYSENTYEVMAGIDSGDIDTPEWIGYQYDGEAMKIWDRETGDNHQGFYTLEDDRG